jgi:hypothetical protein
MGKSDYKKVNNKNIYVQDRLRHKGIFCISNGWIKWAKRYMNRSQRRKERQKYYETENYNG